MDLTDMCGRAGGGTRRAGAGRVDAAGVHRVTLPAYGYRWYRVGGFGYALNARRDSGAGEAWQGLREESPAVNQIGRFAEKSGYQPRGAAPP